MKPFLGAFLLYGSLALLILGYVSQSLAFERDLALSDFYFHDGSVCLQCRTVSVSRLNYPGFGHRITLERLDGSRFVRTEKQILRKVVHNPLQSRIINRWLTVSTVDGHVFSQVQELSHDFRKGLRVFRSRMGRQFTIPDQAITHILDLETGETILQHATPVK